MGQSGLESPVSVRDTIAYGPAWAVCYATLPLLLIPSFLVPLFVMLHTAALMQRRHRSAA